MRDFADVIAGGRIKATHPKKSRSCVTCRLVCVTAYLLDRSPTASLPNRLSSSHVDHAEREGRGASGRLRLDR